MDTSVSFRYLWTCGYFCILPLLINICISPSLIRIKINKEYLCKDTFVSFAILWFPYILMNTFVSFRHWWASVLWILTPLCVLPRLRDISVSFHHWRVPLYPIALADIVIATDPSLKFPSGSMENTPASGNRCRRAGKRSGRNRTINAPVAERPRPQSRPICSIL